LKTAQEIKQMHDEQIIGFHRMLPPFRAKRVDWRQHSLFIKRKQIPAPTLSPLPPLADIPDSLSDQRFDHDGYIDPDLMLTEQGKHETIRRPLF